MGFTVAKGSKMSERTVAAMRAAHRLRYAPLEFISQLIEHSELKWCKGCNQVLPREDFASHVMKAGEMPRLTARCKPCQRVYYNEHSGAKRNERDRAAKVAAGL